MHHLKQLFAVLLCLALVLTVSVSSAAMIHEAGHYPDEETDIIVTGRLESYLEDGYQYLHLVDAELLLQADETL